MAKAKKKMEPVPPAPENKSVVVHQVTVRNVDRTQKDVAAYRSAHQAAESVYYPNRSRIYDMYDDILIDGHLGGIIQKRIDTVLNHPLWFEVNGEVDDKMGVLINSKPFRKMLKEIMQQKFWGLTGFEFIPGKDFSFIEIPRKHIKIEKKVIAFEQSGETGIAYESLPNVWVLGDKKDLGLLLYCAYYVLYKRNNLADWAQYIELFGMPTRVAKYDGNDVNTKVQLQQAINEAGSALAIMIPKQAELEFKDGKQSNGDGQLQMRFHDTVNAEMSKRILGNTETTESSSSSGQAQAKEHGKQQDEIIKSDFIDVRNELNSPQFLNILRSYGYKIPEGGAFVFEEIVDQYEAAAKMTIDKQFPAPLDDDYFYKTYKRPKPKEYDKLKAQQEAERVAKIKHMESSGLNPDKNANPEKEDGDDSDGNENTLRKKSAGEKKNPEAKIKNLSAWQNFRSQLADFFAHGQQD